MARIRYLIILGLDDTYVFQSFSEMLATKMSATKSLHADIKALNSTIDTLNSTVFQVKAFTFSLFYTCTLINL